MQIGMAYTLETSRCEVAGKILELANLSPSSLRMLANHGSCYIRTMTFGDDDDLGKQVMYGAVGDLEKLGAAIVEKHDGKRTYGYDMRLTPLGEAALKYAREFALV